MRMINENGGPYQGQDRFECRKNLWEDMRNAGLVIKEEDYLLNIPRSQRGGEVIEPMISNQWFVRMESLAKPALEASKVRANPNCSRAFYQSVLQLAGEYSGLVYLASALVGSPHPSLVLQ